jgi:hypothetical protein
MITAKVRFCDLIQDHSQRDERLKSEDGLEDVADISVDGPVE